MSFNETIRVGLVNYPYYIIKQTINHGISETLSPHPGFEVECLQLILQISGITKQSYHWIDEDSVGSFQNNRWTGLLGALAYNVVDIAPAVLYPTKDRGKFIHFLQETKHDHNAYSAFINPSPNACFKQKKYYVPQVLSEISTVVFVYLFSLVSACTTIAVEYANETGMNFAAAFWKLLYEIPFQQRAIANRHNVLFVSPLLITLWSVLSCVGSRQAKGVATKLGVSCNVNKLYSSDEKIASAIEEQGYKIAVTEGTLGLNHLFHHHNKHLAAVANEFVAHGRLIETLSYRQNVALLVNNPGTIIFGSNIGIGIQLSRMLKKQARLIVVPLRLLLAHSIALGNKISYLSNKLNTCRQVLEQTGLPGALKKKYIALFNIPQTYIHATDNHRQVKSRLTASLLQLFVFNVTINLISLILEMAWSLKPMVISMTYMILKYI